MPRPGGTEAASPYPEHIPIEADMARKDTGPAPAAPQKFTVVGHVGRFAHGHVVTADDLFPGVTEQADIDARTRRLLGLNALAPHVEFATPEPEAVAAEVIAPIRVARADHPEIASGTVAAPTRTVTFSVPSFAPADDGAAR